MSDENRRDLAIKLHKDSVREHTESRTQRAEDADIRIATVARANELLAHLPGAVALGPAALYTLGAKFPNRRSRRYDVRGSGERDFSLRP